MAFLTQKLIYLCVFSLYWLFFEQNQLLSLISFGFYWKGIPKFAHISKQTGVAQNLMDDFSNFDYQRTFPLKKIYRLQLYKTSQYVGSELGLSYLDL